MDELIQREEVFSMAEWLLWALTACWGSVVQDNKINQIIKSQKKEYKSKLAEQAR